MASWSRSAHFCSSNYTRQLRRWASTSGSQQRYPLYPSVQHLLREHGIGDAEISKITASGPGGRLLKGDVLSYLGKIGKQYSVQQSERLSKLSHLDLSKVQIAPPKTTSPPALSETAPATPTPRPPSDVEVTIAVSLAKALDVQTRVRESLDIRLPLSTFVSRATELANENLPKFRSLEKMSEDDHYAMLLGTQSRESRTAFGDFVPKFLSTEEAKKAQNARRTRRRSKPDVYDVLTGRSGVANALPISGKESLPSPPSNLFSVTVPGSDQRRAKMFLERFKAVLESEPGRLLI